VLSVADSAGTIVGGSQLPDGCRRLVMQTCSYVIGVEIMHRRLILTVLPALSGLLLLMACQVPANRQTLEIALTATPATREEQGSAAVASNCFQPLKVASTLPDDLALSDQSDANCFAWQTFIALNWPADPAHNGQPNPAVGPAAFGQPGNLTPTVWQSYKATQDIFLPGATPPASWDTANTIPAACQAIVSAANLPHQVILHMTAKSSADEVLLKTEEATGQILVDQTRQLIMFEKRINMTEFDYIMNNKLYDADQQAEVATNTGIVLPEGSIEIKSAWRRLDGAPDAIKARYKQTTAFLYDATADSCKGPFVMGLVALHIIRKTATMTQLMWSTFEQIDNVPGSAAPPPHIPYTLYNPTCQPPAPCSTPNAPPMPTPTPPATPTYEPVQVTRTNPIPSDVQQLNTAVQALITQSNQDSVWQYYQLINVLWPQNGGTAPKAGTTIPLSIATSGFTSSNAQPVSNVALETYVQSKTCTSCHQFAAIAPSEKAGCKPKLAADFSFIFNDADTADHYRTNPTCNATNQ
jgi:hypothetical protein